MLKQGFGGTMDTTAVSLSGLNAATLGVAVVANNVANANSKDYKAKRVDFENVREGGVRPSDIQASQETAVPGGSNVDLATEFTNLMSYADTYKVNAKVLEAQQEILGTVMDLKV
jgi:flagellar basal-body rod protein FlgC